MSSSVRGLVGEALALLDNIIYLFTIPGVIVHEAGHYLAAWCLQIPVEEVAWLQLPRSIFDRSLSVLGFVSYDANMADLPTWKRVLTSVAPVISNGIGVWAALVATTLVSGRVLELVCWWLAFAFALHLTPSVSDSRSVFTAVNSLPRSVRPVGVVVAYLVKGFVELGAMFGLIVGSVIASFVFAWVWFELTFIYLGLAVVYLIGLTLYRMWDRGMLNPIAVYSYSELDRQVTQAYNAANATDGIVDDEDVTVLIEGLEAENEHTRSSALSALTDIGSTTPAQLDGSADELAAVLASTDDERVHSGLLTIGAGLVAKREIELDGFTDELARGLAHSGETYRKVSAGAVAQTAEADAALTVDCLPSVVTALVTDSGMIRDACTHVVWEILKTDPSAISPYAPIFLEFTDPQHDDFVVMIASSVVAVESVDGWQEALTSLTSEPEPVGPLATKLIAEESAEE